MSGVELALAIGGGVLAVGGVALIAKALRDRDENIKEQQRAAERQAEREKAEALKKRYDRDGVPLDKAGFQEKYGDPNAEGVDEVVEALWRAAPPVPPPEEFHLDREVLMDGTLEPVGFELDGLQFASVAEDGAGYRAGMRDMPMHGRTIVSVDGKPVTTPEEAQEALARAPNTVVIGVEGQRPLRTEEQIARAGQHNLPRTGQPGLIDDGTGDHMLNLWHVDRLPVDDEGADGLQPEKRESEASDIGWGPMRNQYQNQANQKLREFRDGTRAAQGTEAEDRLRRELPGITEDRIKALKMPPEDKALFDRLEEMRREAEEERTKQEFTLELDEPGETLGLLWRQTADDQVEVYGTKPGSAAHVAGVCPGVVRSVGGFPVHSVQDLLDACKALEKSNTTFLDVVIVPRTSGAGGAAADSGLIPLLAKTMRRAALAESRAVHRRWMAVQHAQEESGWAVTKVAPVHIPLVPRAQRAAGGRPPAPRDGGGGGGADALWTDVGGPDALMPPPFTVAPREGAFVEAAKQRLSPAPSTRPPPQPPSFGTARHPGRTTADLLPANPRKALTATHAEAASPPPLPLRTEAEEVGWLVERPPPTQQPPRPLPPRRTASARLAAGGQRRAPTPPRPPRSLSMSSPARLL